MSLILVAFAINLAGLAFCYLFARRRARVAPADPANLRTDRVWHSAAAFAVIHSLGQGVQQLLVGQAGGFLVVIVGALFLDGAVMLVLVILIDLAMVGPFRVRRVRPWLFAAPGMFAAAYVAGVMLPFAYLTSGRLTGLDSLLLGIVAAAAGFVWWAYLPLGEEPDLGKVFD